jgi:hypothetical protein
MARQQISPSFSSGKHFCSKNFPAQGAAWSLSPNYHDYMSGLTGYATDSLSVRYVTLIFTILSTSVKIIQER